jgi:hypothetical protein
LNRGDNYLFDYEISHSRLHGLNIGITLYGNQGRTLGWTNNLINRCQVALSLQQPAWVNLYNNLFLNGSMRLTTDVLHSDRWRVSDNIFDHMALSLGGDDVFNITHNGFVATAPFSGTEGPSYDYASGYLSGPLGDYYQPSTSTLFNMGSRIAAAAGLYHFTTRTNQLKEGLDGSQPNPYHVDIGLHYVALNGSNLPFDFDSDGWPDYLEDIDGDGVANDKTSWQNYDSPNGASGQTGLILFTPLEN